jgi:hypothetical protein
VRVLPDPAGDLASVALAGASSFGAIATRQAGTMAAA